MISYGIRLKIPAVTSHKAHFSAMKKIDEERLRLCALQAEVFTVSLTVTQCSSPVFIRRFMHSEVAARMDRRGFLLEACDVTSILNEVDTQYGPTSYGKERYGQEELYWLGYLYRYWTYTYEKSSKQVSNSWNSISDFYRTISGYFEINQEMVLFYSPYR